MRILLLLNIFFFPVLSLAGQAPFPESDEIRQFMDSKTYVVLEDDSYSAFNVLIKKSMNEYWKITPFDFISADGFEEKRNDPASSFIVLTETSYENDKSHTTYNFLNLLQGKEVEDLDDMPEICAIPLSSAGEDGLEYGYKLGAVLLFMQKHAQLIAQDPSLTGRRYLRYYNKYVPSIPGKTILAREEDLAPSIGTIEKIKTLYGNKFIIVSEDEIIKAIDEKRPGILVLHKVGPGGEAESGYCFKMLIGTDDSNMYYYDQHMIDKNNPNGFLPSDLKRLARF